jgi:hypothetical protein
VELITDNRPFENIARSLFQHKLVVIVHNKKIDDKAISPNIVLRGVADVTFKDRRLDGI